MNTDGYPDREWRDERIKTLKIMGESLDSELKRLQYELGRINAELKMLEIADWLEQKP